MSPLCEAFPYWSRTSIAVPLRARPSACSCTRSQTPHYDPSGSRKVTTHIEDRARFWKRSSCDLWSEGSQTGTASPPSFPFDSVVCSHCFRALIFSWDSCCSIRSSHATRKMPSWQVYLQNNCKLQQFSSCAGRGGSIFVKKGRTAIPLQRVHQLLLTGQESGETGPDRNSLLSP